MSYPITAQPQGMQQGYAAGCSQWSSEVTDCCADTRICLCGAFAPCILACNLAKDFGECCCLPCLPGTMVALRTGMRERYGIEGSICNDWLCISCCGPCTLCQMSREMQRRKC
ncbi:cornifelin homolog B-like [Eleutherodactylus coqui]|uniref:cornifelin homolog B-like n=1 Tax=Eleutherodactylus coqui TaxID=57060 RepID=UPI003462C50A